MVDTKFGDVKLWENVMRRDKKRIGISDVEEAVKKMLLTRLVSYPARRS